MRVHLYVRPRDRMQQTTNPPIMAALEGLRRHGLDPVVLPAERPRACDLAVVWGVKRPHAMASGRRALVLECGYIGDRTREWFSAGYDGLNGKADFCNRDVPSDRWDKHFARYMRPWRGNYDGEYVLIMGQVANDFSVRGIVNIRNWYRDVAGEIARAGHVARFRPHPNDRSQAIVPGAQTLHGSLDAALASAKWVVTFNSNSGVNAVLYGVPAVTVDRGAMSWDVTGHKIASPPPMPDRSDWGRRMGYTQWNIDELRDGVFWEHLRQGMDHVVAVREGA